MGVGSTMCVESTTVVRSTMGVGSTIGVGFTMDLTSPKRASSNTRLKLFCWYRNYSALGVTDFNSALTTCDDHGLGLVKWDSLDKWKDVVAIAGN